MPELLLPLVTAALVAAGVPAGAGIVITATYTLTYAAIATALVTIAIGVGLTLLFAPKPPTPVNGVVPVQQPLPYRIFGVGRARVSGAIMLKEAAGPTLVYVAALVGHLVDAFEALYLNDDLVTVPVVGNLLQGAVSAGTDGRYGSNLISIDTRVGLSTETAYSNIVSLIPSEWTTNHRGDGSASIGMVCGGTKQDNFVYEYPYAAPSPSVIARLAPVYDLRDVTQDPTNPTTFKWSQNVALQIIWFLCFSEYGFRAPFETAILPFASAWIQAANDCDDPMALKAGGTEPRYAGGGWTTTEQARSTTLLTLLACCDGFLSRRSQAYVLQVGKYVAPTVSLTDDDICGWSLQTDVATEDRVNEAVAIYTSPECDYITVDTDPVIDAVDQAARGGAPRKAQLQLPWVQSTGQASRLLAREMFRQTIGTRGTLTIFWSGLNAVFERWIQIDSNTMPLLSGAVIENTKAVINPKTRTCEIDWILSGPDIDDYDPETQESAPPFVPQRPATVGLPVPANVIIVAVLFSDSSGASNVVLDISCDVPQYNGSPWPGLTYMVQYRLTDAGSGSPGPWVQQNFNAPTIVGSRVEVQTTDVPPGTSLDVQMGTVGTGLTLSTLSAIQTISTVYANLAPDEPTWTSATGGSGTGGNGDATLIAVAPNSANTYGLQFWRATSGAPFSSAVAIGAVQTCAPLGSVTYNDVYIAGTYDYFCTTETSASVSSPPAGPETTTTYTTYTTQASAFFARLATQPTTARKALYDAMIGSLVTAGVWAELDVLYVFAAADSPTALTNLVSASFGASTIGSPTFTADHGFAGDGSTTGVNSNFNPSTAGGNFTQNSNTFGAYDLTSATSQPGELAGGISAGIYCYLAPCLSSYGGTSYFTNNSGTNFSPTLTNVQGLITNNRSGSAAQQVYQNGSSLGTGTISSTGLLAVSIYVCGTNNAGTFTMGTTNQISAFVAGGSLTSTQQTALYSALHTFMQTVAGAP